MSIMGAGSRGEIQRDRHGDRLTTRGHDQALKEEIRRASAYTRDAMKGS